VENLWNSLCFLMIDNPANQLAFGKMEGVELMINLIRYAFDFDLMELRLS